MCILWTFVCYIHILNIYIQQSYVDKRHNYAMTNIDEKHNIFPICYQIQCDISTLKCCNANVSFDISNIRICKHVILRTQAWTLHSRTLDPFQIFACLFFSSHSRFFHSYGDVTITDERMQILTYVRHLWPLSSEGSLACQTFCDTGHPFIMVISEDPWHSHLLPSVWQ